MAHCRSCGGKLRRVHRTLGQRFLYMGIFECRQCKENRKIPRRYTYYLSKTVRCPLCGTYRLRPLLERDRIDRMHNNPMTVLHRIIGDCRLYHCRYCRIQFYDRRPLTDEKVVNGTVTRS